MSVLKDWINPYYLRESTKKAIREDILSKPYVKYTCLDNFFREEKLDELISHHHHLAFSEAKDRYSGRDSELLPYDGAVVWAERDKHFGSDLFFSSLWHDDLAFISATKIRPRLNFATIDPTLKVSGSTQMVLKERCRRFVTLIKIGLFKMGE